MLLFSANSLEIQHFVYIQSKTCGSIFDMLYSRSFQSGENPSVVSKDNCSCNSRKTVELFSGTTRLVQSVHSKTLSSGEAAERTVYHASLTQLQMTFQGCPVEKRMLCQTLTLGTGSALPSDSDLALTAHDALSDMM